MQRNWVKFFTATLLATAAQPLWANQTRCVTNDAQLADAIDLARFSPVTIMLATGTYDLKNTDWHDGQDNPRRFTSGSQILGGYSGDCSTRNIQVGNTKLDDSASGAYLDGFDIAGNATIEGLTWIMPGGMGISIGLLDGVVPGSEILITRNAAMNQPSNGRFDVFWEGQNGDGDTIRVVDNLVASNHIQPGFCAFGVTVHYSNPDVQIINNTVVANSGSQVLGACMLNDDGGSPGNATFQLYNNIFYGNSDGTMDLLTDQSKVILVNNIIGSFNGPLPEHQEGTQTGDPKLNTNFQPIQSPPSPVINTGNNSVPGGAPTVDINGNPRIVGGRIDRGAFESTVDFADTQLVTSNADDSTAGTLRSAINNVNNNGGGRIRFNLGTGCGPHVITLSSALPDLTVDMTIEGFSQTGASPNTIDPGNDATVCIILEAAGGGVDKALYVPSTADGATSVTINGLGFSGFGVAAIDLQGGSQHGVNGNHFGGNVGGHAMNPNAIDIRVGAASQDNTIGSDDIADRNIIGDATGSGIVLAAGTTNNQIVGNYIGMGWSAASNSYSNLGNGTRGIYLLGHANTITGNLIGNSGQAGILLDSGDAIGNTISKNGIGADGDDNAFGNSNAGIHLIGSSGDAPSGNDIRGNTLAHNGDQGVLIDIGQGNTIRKNSIYGNALLGIDLDAVGPAFPQVDDGNTQIADFANRGQNFPVLQTAVGGETSGYVSGSLTTTPGDYTIDFYLGAGCDSSGYGEGKTWLGSITPTVDMPKTGDQGTIDFHNVKLVAPSANVVFLDGDRITATATDSNGNTSEFSACVTYDNDTVFANGFDPSS